MIAPAMERQAGPEPEWQLFLARWYASLDDECMQVMEGPE